MRRGTQGGRETRRCRRVRVRLLVRASWLARKRTLVGKDAVARMSPLVRMRVVTSVSVVGPKAALSLKAAVGLRGVAGPREAVASRAGGRRRAPKVAPGVTIAWGVSRVGRAAGRAGSLIIVRVGGRRVKAALGIVAARGSSGDSNPGAMVRGGVQVPAAVTPAVGFVRGRGALVRGARVRGAGLVGQVASSLTRVRKVSGSRKHLETDSANLG